MLKNESWREEMALKMIFGTYRKKKIEKKIEKKPEKNFFFVKNPKILMGSNFFLSRIGAQLLLQNAVLWFFRPGKRKFRRKIALIGIFSNFNLNL